VKTNIDVDFELRRCWTCGRFYYIERERRADCPYCAVRLEHEAQAFAAQLARSIVALRGTITRLKKRRR